jgi:hypothetical protein
MTYSNSIIFSFNPIKAAIVGTVGGVVAYRKLGDQ